MNAMPVGFGCKLFVSKLLKLSVPLLEAKRVGICCVLDCRLGVLAGNEVKKGEQIKS
jgi:hypothetical protein